MEARRDALERELLDRDQHLNSTLGVSRCSDQFRRCFKLTTSEASVKAVDDNSQRPVGQPKRVYEAEPQPELRTESREAPLKVVCV
jgi:hypothetical protein